ncbi:MAG: hypothetical protein VKJ06_00130 [Vampirovibrionales bacterium]|nr:hypothetical protein [Vampirovibrionales bacterium]
MISLLTALVCYPAFAVSPKIYRTEGFANYYLLTATRNGDIIRTTTKRVGKNETGFTLSENNCRTKQFKELGYGEGTSETSIKLHKSTQWSDLFPGSSRQDLMDFVCTKITK